MPTLEGKTKQIVVGPQPHTVLLKTKDSLTGGDAAKVATIDGIATHKTTQTANVFRLLEQHHIPTSFLEHVDETTLLCHACDMLPLECVMRRYAWGSFLKREPQYESTTDKPYRFEQVRAELFHKHAVVMPPLVPEAQQMEESEARQRYLKDGVWKEGVHTDPYLHLGSQKWQLHPAKTPLDLATPLMNIPPLVSEQEQQALVEELMIPCFETLEKAWSHVNTEQGPVILADMKIEIGKRQLDGKWVIADVIDNDSWRIWPGGNPKLQLDKQAFRDGNPLSHVANNYALVSELTHQFLQ